MVNINTIDAIVQACWREAGGPEEDLSRLKLHGAEPVLPSSFRMAAVAQASIALSGLAAACIHRERTGAAQDVALDIRHACAEFQSEQHYSVHGRPTPELWDKIAGVYCCGDQRWVRIHTNFLHHRDGVLALLECAYDKAAVAAALTTWKAEDFESEATARGLVVSMMRSFDEWDAHPQAAALRSLPLHTTQKLEGESVPRRWPDHSTRPLSGIRVLDLTRIIAGPVCTRALASHGAEVLTISSPLLPSIDAVIDTGRGKRAAFVNLKTAAGREVLRALVSEADVLVQGYRPGGLEALGFGAQDLAALRPGIVVVSLSAYGHTGPWAGKRGFDSLTQTATGFNHAEAMAAGSDKPKAFPCQVLDHGTGFLMAFVAMMALRRQRQEGGSWHVQLSLAQTALWLRSLGRVDEPWSAPGLSAAEIESFSEVKPSGHGELKSIRPAVMLSRTPAHYLWPSVPLGSHPAAW